MKNITEKSIVAISENLKYLEGLDISFCDGIKGDYLVNLKKCQALNILLLKGIKLKDSDFVFTEYLANLKTLSIASNKKIFTLDVGNITNGSIDYLIRNCSNLENLDIEGNLNINETSKFICFI
jgi:hypothetical protein